MNHIRKDNINQCVPFNPDKPKEKYEKSHKPKDKAVRKKK